MVGDLTTRRHLDLEGAYNIRDIGGYVTSDGRSIRWRTMLRGDSLHRLPPVSEMALIEHGVRTVIDLRTTAELQSAPDVFVNSSSVRYIHRNILGDVKGSEDSNLQRSIGDAERRLKEIYITALDHRRPMIVDTLGTLAEPNTLPALFHCFAGKDRTGLIAALLLGLVGVPAEVIAEDYAMSSVYLSKGYFDPEAAPEIDASGCTLEEYQREYCYCAPDLMLDTLRHIDKGYGGIEEYVTEGGLDQDQIEMIRKSLLE